MTADRNGNWQVADLPLQTNSLIGNYPNTVFTISAVTVGSRRANFRCGDGQRSCRVTAKCLRRA